HNGNGLIAKGDDCLKCHPKTFKLKPNDHTTAFVTKNHGKRATKDPAYCSMCHAPIFCVTCHTGKSPSPSAPTTAVIPANHRDAKWNGEHGKEFSAGKGLCGSCHSGPSCQRCHKTVMPHPAGWVENHKPKNGITADDCNICHRNRDTCQNCHHSKVRNAELIAKNCKCHEEMKIKPATSIKNKAFAEHAVHFNVAKKKGKPYKCYECHVDFGSSEAARKVELQQGHDLRLCYSCHGNLDPFNQLIAPYKGAELCLRCHQNLNI
ncbi:MAG: cytochrome c3 family protein, partial [Bacteroidota bacterium]